MPDLSQILISLIYTVMSIPIIALVLWVITKLFKLAKSSFLTALKTTAAAAAALFVVQQIISVFSNAAVTSTESIGVMLGITGVVFMITIIASVLVNAYAVKIFYKEKTGKAFLVGIVWTVANFIIGMILGVIFIGIATAIIIGTSAAGGLA